MKKLVLQAIGICILGAGHSVSAVAQSQFEGCFTQHIRESIELNKTRKAAYSKLSHGQSKKISNLLILTEKATLLFTKGMEKRAAEFERADVPVLCHGFVSMSLVPALQTTLDAHPSPLQNYVKEQPFSLRREMKKAYKAKGFEGVSEVVTKELARLSDPQYNCMERHVLDSISRFVNQAPEHSLRAKSKNLGDTQDLTWRVIRLHMMSLPVTSILDRWAAPLQAQGLRILCNDVPPL